MAGGQLQLTGGHNKSQFRNSHTNRLLLDIRNIGAVATVVIWNNPSVRHRNELLIHPIQHHHRSQHTVIHTVT